MKVRRFIDADAAGAGAGTDVCGVLVHAHRDAAGAVQRRLSELPGVEVHEVTDDGRLIVTVESTAEASAGETIHRFYEVAGVLSASLAYHYHEAGVLQGEVAR